MDKKVSHNYKIIIDIRKPEPSLWMVMYPIITGSEGKNNFVAMLNYFNASEIVPKLLCRREVGICWLIPLQWRHTGHDSVSNHQPHDFLLRRRSNITNQSPVSLAFVRGIQRWSMNSLHKWPVTRKMFPFHDVIIASLKHPQQTIITVA